MSFQRIALAYTLNRRGFILSQVDLHDLRAHKVLVVPFALATGTKQFVQDLRILVDELSELRVLDGDLLEERLYECRVLLNHLSQSAHVVGRS